MLYSNQVCIQIGSGYWGSTKAPIQDKAMPQPSTEQPESNLGMPYAGTKRQISMRLVLFPGVWEGRHGKFDDIWITIWTETTPKSNCWAISSKGPGCTFWVIREFGIRFRVQTLVYNTKSLQNIGHEKNELRHMVPLQEKAKVCTSHPPLGVCTSRSFREFEPGICRTAVLWQDCTDSYWLQTALWLFLLLKWH